MTGEVAQRIPKLANATVQNQADWLDRIDASNHLPGQRD